MPDPLGLLAAARQLASPSGSQEQLSRAVSTAYYSIFHKVSASGAARFAGPDRTRGAYTILYRGFQHGRVKAVCESLTAKSLSAGVQRQLGRTSVSLETIVFARNFCRLQERRHEADYDPGASFTLDETRDIIERAEDTLTIFDAIHPDEQADILALMLAPGRS